MVAKISFSAVVVFIFLMITLTSHPILAQETRKWELGVTGNYGKDRFRRTYYNFVLPPGLSTSYKSNYSWESGIWGERYFGPFLSVIIELSYFQNDVPTNTLCDCSYTGAVWLQKEKHHWGALGGGLRWYLNPRSSVNLFIDGKVKMEGFLAMVEHRNNTKVSRWNAYGYQRLVPTFSGAVGVKWNRLALMGEYDHNIARTFTKQIGYHYGIKNTIKSNIMRQGFTLKAAFSIIKPR